ncbi:cell envelope integrity protein TolA [Pediococcus pentosaceus]|uniref:cell envelope integrity protein TolA n=1 Tax=Pediococcus pentosaceus TaxID=1255 RepID=UPI0015A07AFF|nr:cell envelope integrity protein TolA [Pediococcus pentosaceus]NVZ00226.1 cell envelope integrity protein TolA [Pediococcus pentosaceus]
MSSIGQGSISIDDSTRIGENAQDTANEVAGNVNDINSDNKLTPSEKLKLKQEYDKDVELYSIDIEQLKSVDLPTAELETAMSNLTDFVTPLFKEMNRTSTVDRDTLDSVFTAFATADKNSSQAFVNMVQQVADDAKKAGSDAKKAGEKAQEAGEEAKASANQAKVDATQAKADAATAQQKAQSSIDQLDTHLPDIDEALSTANLVKQSVTKLSDTTERYHNEYTTGIQNVVKTIDDITVGGTNLIKNSKFDDKMNGWHIWDPRGIGTSTVQINPTGGGGNWPRQAIYLAKIINPEADKNNQFGIAQDNIPVEPNTEYTFQLFNDGADPITVQHGNGSNDPYVTKVLGSHRTTWTFKIPADVYNTNIYIGFDSGQSGTAWISLTKLEKGNKPTDWNLSPFDIATSTEIDQLSNAIKLKADSSDVTSQITVAVQSVQSEVNDKVTDLNTKISQTSDAVQILSGSVGSRNLVYNATFEQMTNGFPMGWTKNGNASNETGYVSDDPASSYQGRNSIGVNTSKEMGWVMFAQSDPQPLPIDNNTDATNNVYSASMMVKVYGDGGAKPNGHVCVILAFFDTNKKRIENDAKAAWSKTATESKEQWHLVKAEGLTPVANAKYVAIQAFAYGVPTHAMVNQPMVNIGATAQPFKPDMVNQASITASINNINLKVSNSDGSSSQVNINNDTILLDANKIIFNGNTSIQNGTIGTAKIANAAINTAQIADGAINNAKIANASIDDAKINSLNGNKLVENSITANKINVDDLIANGINTKTLTSVNLNTSTLTTPQLDLGLNGTFTEDFDYAQAASMFLPKKNKGTLTFNHGVLQSEGNMQTYVGGKWGGMNDNLVFQSGIDNAQWTEIAPGYLKMDLYKQDGTTVAQRTYSDPTGFYYTSMLGNKSYLGNVLQTAQVQTSSVLTKYIGPSNGELRLQIGNNGSHYGFQVGSYAGSEAVLSDFIYSSTSSASPDIHITEGGHLVRTTSASKYKYNIKNPDIETTLGDRLLNVHLATWNDKRAVDLFAEQLSTGEEREKSSIDKYYGLIAEQLRDAGLDMFINYGKNHEIEGIQYDRAWVPLLSVIRRLNDKVNEYELRLSKLEGASK